MDLQFILLDQIKDRFPIVGSLLWGEDIIAHPSKLLTSRDRPIEIKKELKPYVGRSNFTFFSTSLLIKNGSTAPDAFPTDTIVPLRFINLKLLSKLMELDCMS